MEQIGTRNIRDDFIVAYSVNISRRGAPGMLDWLDRNGFFEAPASGKYHLAQPGGLATHSMNVFKRLLEITERDMFKGTGEGYLSRDVMETVAILGLLHDVCKVGVYHQETKRRKSPDTGKWEDCLGYTFRDPFPLGHGEKSLFLIARHMELTEEEALAIRWHMGAYDDAVKGGGRAMTEAMNLSPWVWRLQEADMCAAWIDEKEDKPE